MTATDLEPVPEPLLVFRLSDEAFSVRLSAIKEIHRPRHLRPVPQAPAAIRGLADVRGRMVTAADLPGMFGVQAQEDLAGHLMILAEPKDHFALWVPTEIDLLSLDLRKLKPRPAGEGEPELFDGFLSSGSDLVNLLSTEKIFLHCEQEVLRRYRVVSG